MTKKQSNQKYLLALVIVIFIIAVSGFILLSSQFQGIVPNNQVSPPAQTVKVVLSPSSLFVSGKQTYINGLSVPPFQNLTTPIDVTITGEANYPCTLSFTQELSNSNLPEESLGSFYRIILYTSGLPKIDVSTQIQGSVEYSSDSANILPNFSTTNSNTWILPNIAYLPTGVYYVTITDSKGASITSNTVTVEYK